MLRERLTSKITRRLLTLPLVVVALLGANRAMAATETIKAGFSAARAATEAVLPGPLGRRDVELYRQIFALQEEGRWDAADRLIARLSDHVLLGHVLYQRYMHPTAYRSRFEELAAWLDEYADHPGASRIYRLARRRQPRGAKAPARPVRGYLGGAGQEVQEQTRIRYRTELKRSPFEDAKVRAWRQTIDRLVATNRPEQAEAKLREGNVAGLIDRVEADLARWMVARGYFGQGRYGRALRLAGRAAARSGARVPAIHWIAGLAAWRLGEIRVAAWHFAALARAEDTLAVERSRAAFWAARAYVALF